VADSLDEAKAAFRAAGVGNEQAASVLAFSVKRA
jgi:hypothetical protein